MSELDALDPSSEQVKLESGVSVLLEPLKARQFFKLLRIITHGALPNLRDPSILSMDGTQEEYVVKLLTVTVMAIPEAEDETLEFLRSMVRPVGLIERRGMSEHDKERNELLWEQVDAELDNPSLDDLITLVEAIVRREAADIQALGKRLAGLMKLAEKTGQLKPSRSPKDSTPNSSEGSPESSTSSRPSMATTAKTTSANSRSAASAKSSPRSVKGASKRAGSVSNG